MATVNEYVPERRHLAERRTLASRSDNRATTHTMSAVDWIAMAFLIIGGLNWGLVGLMDLDVVGMLFGEGSALTRVIYLVVGLSALYSIYTASKMSRAHLS